MAAAPLTYDGRRDVATAFRDHWQWLLALGAVFMAFGAIGIASAVLLRTDSVVLFGLLLLSAAVLQALETYRARTWRARWPYLVLAIAYAAAAVVMLVDPVDAALALTMVLSILLIATGLIRVALAVQISAVRWRAWVLVAGLAFALLGTAILAGVTQIALWAVGFLVAVELLVNGALCVFLALTARRRDAQPAEPKARTMPRNAVRD